MHENSNQYFVSLFQAGSRTCSVAVIALGVLSLLGWLFHIPVLKSIHPGLAAMKANTALSFVLAGLSLWLLQPGKPDGRKLRIARWCAGIVTLVGLLTLSEYVLKLDFGIDQLLFEEPAGAVGTSIPGRMAPNTAFNFILLGLAMVFPDSESRKGYRPAQFLAMLALVVAFLAFIGYVFGVNSLLGIFSYTNMALNTMLAFLALSLGILWARPTQGLMALPSGNGAGASSARRLLPAVILIPVALGLLHIEGERSGLASADFGLTLMVLLNVLFLVFLVWLDCRSLERVDAERRHAEEALKESERNASALINAADESIWLIGLNSKVLAANITAAVRVGLKPDEIAGKTLKEIFHPHIAESRKKKLDEVIQAGEPVHFEDERSGIIFDHTYYPVWDKAGNMTAIATFSRDITERKRNEEDRQISVDFLRMLNESRCSVELIRGAVPFFREKSDCEAVGIRLREGDDYPYFEVNGFPEEFVHMENNLCDFDENGKVICDSAGKAVLACMCGSVICERFDPSKPFFTSHGSFWTNCTSELLKGTTEADRQGHTRNRCNGEGYESMALIPLSMGEERLGLLQLNDRRLGRFTPATIALWERLSGYLSVALTKFRAEEAIKELNTTLQQSNAQLAVANKEMEAFNYSVSHDLRSPLRSLDGFSLVLLDEYGDKLDSEGRDCLRRIRAASQRLGQLIDDLLELSRVSRGKMTLKTVDLGAMASEIADDLRNSAPQRRAAFVIEKGLVTDADPRLLRIVLLNLLGNAWKFTGKQPEARIEFGCREEDGGKSYFVRDNGVGFDMAYTGKLFGSFQRLHAKDDFPGTGIGLATVQRIIHRHGGRIWAESAPDKGATFYFTL